MRIAVAMSGGVDSSVAAFELRKKGYDLTGVTIKTWGEEECSHKGERLCCSAEAVRHARSVAEDLGIPHRVIDLSAEFDLEVKKYFVDEYVRGRTPNPCIYCNSKIKFGCLFRKIREFGCGKIATGHYARILTADGKYYLAEAEDDVRDQSYFLYDVPNETLPFIEFPLAGLTKEDVRKIAREQNFVTAGLNDSQDICFAQAEGGYREYLRRSGIDVFKPGKILDTTGKTVGEHKGIVSYTVGQRRGIGLALPEPVYVLKIDSRNNTITVGTRSEAMSRKIRVTGITRETMEVFCEPKKFGVRIRYNSRKAVAMVFPSGQGEVTVDFDEPQFAPTPGQASVFYDNELVAGGGWIEEVIF